MESRNKPRIGSARNIARKLLKDANITNSPIVINDVVNYLKKTRDISVLPWSFGEKTDGIQVSQGDSIIIGYNKSQHPHRQRFTVAHEIGHYLMGHARISYDYDLKSADPKEIEANQFAAELLMPLAMLKIDLRTGKKPKDLIAIYDVSEESLWWRLLDQKLI